MFRIAICDDHNDICIQVENLATEVCSNLGIRCEIDIYYDGGGLSESLLSGTVFDLIFLDIELGELSGVDIGNLIRNVKNDEMTQIAYISSKTEYALELFDINPINFLIKPLKYVDIEKVIKKYIKIIGVDSHVFTYKYGHDIYKVKINDIMYFRSEKRKIHIILKSGKDEFYGRLEQIYNEQLKNFNFLFIHQSFLVNYKYVTVFEYEKLIMANGDILPISQSKRKEIREFQLELERKAILNE